MDTDSISSRSSSAFTGSRASSHSSPDDEYVIGDSLRRFSHQLDILGDSFIPKIKVICCVGAGYVGGPTAAVIAFQNPSIQVFVVDKDPVRIKAWNSKHLPVHEPGLERIVRIARDGTSLCSADPSDPTLAIPKRVPNLTFSTNVTKCIGAADIVFLSVNTPTKASGIGAGAATDLTAFEGAVTAVAQAVKQGAIIVEKSTVPCGTAHTIREILTLYRPDDRFEVLSNPEFLAEGTAVNDLLYPDRILIGSSMTPTGHAAAAALRSVYTAWVDPARVLTVNVWSSELAKLVANAMLAQRISSINTISAICDQTGADIDEISKAIGLDSRLGGGFLKAGLGFGGSCFKKDILSLTYLARSLHLPEVADYWMSVLSVNDFQRNRFTKKVVTALNGALVGKKITVLGYTFKQDTNDTRESPAIDVIKALLHERPREIAIFDPACTTSEIKKNIMALICTTHPDVVKPIGPVEAYDNAYEACKDSSAVLILTPWKQFRYPQPPLDSEIAVGNIVSPSSLLQDLSMRDMVEMDIMYLESRRRASLTMAERLALKDEADPLNRLVDRPVCGKECLLCQEGTKPAALKAHDNIDWAKVAGSMKEPKWVFDGRNIVDSDGMTELGFRVDNLGKRKSLMAQSRNSSVW